MEEQDKKIEFNGWEDLYNVFLDVIKRWYLILLLAVVAAVAADAYLTVTHTPQYRTQAIFAMKMNTVTSSDQEEMSAEVAEAFGYVIESNVFKERVRADLGLKSLDAHYETKHVEGTNMIRVTATADSPRTAYMMMYYMMQHYQEVSGLVVGDMQIDVLERMNVVTQPYNQLNHMKNLLVFGGISMAAAAVVIGLFSYMKDTVKGKKQIEDKLHVRMLAAVVREKKWIIKRGKIHTKKSILITQLTTSFYYIEAFKRIRSRVERLSEKYGYQVLMVTSALENEGKSSVAVNTGIALAKNRKRVLMIDMDLRKPALYKVMDFQEEDAVGAVLRGEKKWKEVLHKDARRQMDFLLVGTRNTDVSELLESEHFEKLIEEVRAEYDYILIDSPPLNYISDSVILTNHVDAVILTVRQNYAPTVLIQRAIEKMSITKTPILGCVLNQSTPIVSKVSKEKGYYYTRGEKE